MAGLVAVVISTPLNIIFWRGITGNIWGDTVYAWGIANNLLAYLASALDKIVTNFNAFVLYNIV